MVYKRAQLKKIAATLARRLRAKSGLQVDEIYLFGSYAWGRPTSRSDIDLAVVSSKFARIDGIKRIEVLSSIVRHIDTDSPVDIDAIGFTPKELGNAGYFELASAVRENGVRLYRKSA